MYRQIPTHVIALALLAGCEVAIGAHAAALLAVLLPLTGAVLLFDGRGLRRAPVR